MYRPNKDTKEYSSKSKEDLIVEIKELRNKLLESEETINAIRNGDVDALIMSGPNGDQVYSLEGSDSAYRTLIEDMYEGAAILMPDRTIFYCNKSLARILEMPLEMLMGKTIDKFIPTKDFRIYESILNKGFKGTGKGEVTLKTNKGSLIPAYLSVQSLEVENFRVISIIITDLSEQKRFEDLIKAEKALRESEKKFRALFNTMLQGVVYQNADGKITSMNPAAEKIMGYTFDKIQNRTSDDPLWQAIHEDGTPFPGEEHPSMIALKTGKEVKNAIMGVKYPTRNEYTWLDINAVPEFRPGEETPYQVYTTFNDITDRKKAEEALRESEERFRTVVENSQDGINLLDLKTGKYIFMSPSQIKVTGFTEEEMNNFPVEEAYERTHPDDREITINQQKMVAAGEDIPRPVEYRWKVKSGEYRWFSDSRKLIRDEKGQPVALVGVSRDITNQKKAQEELKKAHDHLEEKVEERTSELEEAYTQLKENELKLKDSIEELKRSNKELQSFAYITSHDLQEPLRNIASFAQLLQRRYKGQLDENADDFIEFMVDGAARMKNMIQGLLEYSRIDRDNEFIETDMNLNVDKALSNLKLAIDESNAEITVDNLPIVYANPDQIVRVFQNLIGNAIKFKKPNLTPRIHISSKLDTENCEYVFSVEDNGIGIESQYTDKIFEVFKRLHTINQYEGTGIGLPVVKKIIESHGGRIWVKSELEFGSTFYFTIPHIKLRKYKEDNNPHNND